MGVQKLLLVASVIISAMIGLVLIPVLTRSYSEADFALLSVLLVLNSFFGVADGMRPSVVKCFSEVSGRISYGGVALLSASWGVVVSPALYIVLSLFFSEYFSPLEALMLSLSIFIYMQYTALWGVMDLNGRVGTGAIIRSLGTAFMYVLFSLAPMLFEVVPLVFMFLFVQIAVLVAYLVSSSRHIDSYLRGVSSFHALAPLARFTLHQNLSKAVCDFLDRAFISASAGAGVVAIYNVCFELSSKTNLPSQIYSSYKYPELCKEKSSIQRYLNIGFLVSFLMFLVAVLVSPWIDVVFAYYSGLDGNFGGALLSCMLILASVYSLAFYAQAGLRAAGRFLLLKRIFFYCACLGAALVYPAYNYFGVAGVLASVLFMRFPGVVAYCYCYLYEKKSRIFGGLFLLYLILLLFAFFFYLAKV